MIILAQLLMQELNEEVDVTDGHNLEENAFMRKLLW